MDNTMQISGLPLHPLLVHAVVVLIPLTVAALLLSQFWPAARRRLGAVTPAAALAVAVLVPLTVAAGRSLAQRVGPLPSVQTHQHYATMLLPWALALFAVAGAQWWWFTRGVRRYPVGSGTLARVAPVFLAVASIVVGAAILTLVVVAGDTGARAVWGGLLG